MSAPGDDDSAELDNVEQQLRAIRDNPERSAMLRALAQTQLDQFAALRAAENAPGNSRQPEVAVQRLEPFTVSSILGTGMVGIEIDQDSGVPLVAVVSSDEIRQLMPMFQHVQEHAERGESARIDVRAAFLDLIGRDPFDDQA